MNDIKESKSHISTMLMRKICLKIVDNKIKEENGKIIINILCPY